MVLTGVNSPSCQVSYKVTMFDVGSYDFKKKLLQPSNYGYIMIYTCHLTIYIPSKYLTSSIENHLTSSIYDPNQPYTEEQLGAPHIRCQVTLLECTRHLQLGQITSAHGLDRKGEAENHSFLICLVVQ